MRAFFIFPILIFSISSYGFDRVDTCEIVIDQSTTTVVPGVEPQYKPVTLVYPEDFFDTLERHSLSNITPFDQEFITAIQEDDILAVCEALKKGANVNAINVDGNPALIEAVKNGSSEIAKFLLLHPRINVNIQSYDQSTALIESIKSNMDEVSLLLLDNETIAVNLVGGKWNWNALNWALHQAEAGRLEVVKKLLSREDIEINPRVNGTEPPIMIASIRSWILGFDIINKILKHPELDAGLQDADGENALMGAARYGNLYLINELLKRDDVDVNHYMFQSGFTPLSLAAYFGQDYVVNALLKVPGIDVNNSQVSFSTSGNISALMEASYVGHTNIVRKLLAQPGIDSFVMDGAGKTSFDYAVSMGHLEIAQMLYAHMLESLNLEKLELTIKNRCINVNVSTVPIAFRAVNSTICNHPNWKLTPDAVNKWFENLQTQVEAVKQAN